MAEVATLELAITGKSDADQMMQSVASAATALNQTLLQLTGGGTQASAAIASAGSAATAASSQISSVSSNTSNAASGFEALGSSASGSAGSLTAVSGAASQAGSASQEAGAGAQVANAGMQALGGGSQLASQGLNSAGQAAAGFGVNVQPATQAGNELVGVLSSMTGGLLTFITTAGVAAVAIAGIGAALVGEVLQSTAKWVDELGDLADVTGIAAQSLAGLQIRMEEQGGSIQDAGSALSFFTRQLEGVTTAAVNEGAAQSAAASRTAENIADAQRSLAQAYQDTQQAIQDATDKEATNLEDLASKHAETIAKIKESIQSLTEDYADAEKDRADNFNDSIRTRKDSERDSLANSADSHDQSLARIAQQQHRADEQMANAKTAQARASARDAQAAAALSLKQENENFTRQQAAILKRDADQDARDKKRYDKQEADAQKAYDKKILALQKSLDDENTKYAAQVTKEQARYDAELARLNQHYAREEAANAAHIAKMSSGGAGGGSSAPSEFEIELNKILTAAGETGPEIAAQMAKIREGSLQVGDILPNIADGFKKQAEAAKANGQSINQMGEVYKLFGRGASADFLAVLREGGDAFRDDGRLAKEAGIDYDAAAGGSAEYLHAMADLHAEMRGLKTTIATELAPTVNGWLKFLNGWVRENRAEIIGFFEKMGRGAALIGEFVNAHKQEVIDFFVELGKNLEHVNEVITGTNNFPDAMARWGKAFARDAEAIKNVYNIFFLPVIDGIGGFIALLNGDGTKALSDWHDSLSNFLGFDAAKLGKPFDDFGKKVGEFFTGIKNLKWSGLWDGLASGMKGAVNIAIDALNGLIGGLNKIQLHMPAFDTHLPGVGKVGGIGWDGPNISKIPHLFEGGIAMSPTLAMIGDRGPEAVIPLNKMGAGGITINMNNVKLDANDKSRARKAAMTLAVAMRASQGLSVL